MKNKYRNLYLAQCSHIELDNVYVVISDWYSFRKT